MTKIIQLTLGKTTQVDDEDYEMLKDVKWCVSDGYAYSAKLGRMHRHILSAPQGLMVDHINGDKLDNRRENLRLCTNSLNQANRKAVRGASPFKGVTWQKHRGPSTTGTWKAQIVVNGQVVYLGTFATDVDAAAAYNAAATEHFGQFAALNDLSTPGCPRVSDTRRQVNRKNPSGYRGVTYDATRGKWMAQLAYKGVTHLKKRFDTAEAAAEAYDTVARAIHGTHARTNF